MLNLNIQNKMEKETLDEVAERFADMCNGNLVSKYSFITGAKWQAGRMYSEDEVLNFTQIILSQYAVGNTNIDQLDLLKETLHIFKNK